MNLPLVLKLGIKLLKRKLPLFSAQAETKRSKFKSEKNIRLFCKSNGLANIQGGVVRPGSTTSKALHITQRITKACDAFMTRKYALNSNEPNYSWNSKQIGLRSVYQQAK